ncbi:restriction endonuclease subunit S [Candidatus Poriferisodalis sp.]|uniref:restriction endonuclease subunit S n=1 Tax=Candidatus Poriferisodalis sp. TaxID=3101277 RepID=UPI003B010BEB
MKAVPVSEFAARVDYGVTASASRDPIGPKMLRITDIHGTSVNWSTVPHCASATKGVQDRQLEVGDIVFARTGSTGNSLLIRDCPEGAVFASYLIRLRVQPEVADAGYVSHFFRSPGYWRQIASASDGGVQKGVNASKLKKLLVPLPRLGEQRRIASVLDAAEALRAKRRRAVAKLDELIEAIFHDMFGDPLTSDAVARAPIGSLASVVTGNTPSRSNPAYFGDHIEWLKTDNIRPSGEIERAAEHLSESGRAKGREAPAGSTLVVCIAGSPSSIGRVGLLDRRAAFNQQINAVVPGPELRALFLFHQLKTAQRLVQRASTDSMKGMVSKTALAAVEVLVPPLNEQDTFVDVAEQVRTMRRCSSKSLDANGTLFASLQQRAFRGEL